MSSPTDEPALDPVLAHSLLGTVAAIKGAIDTVMAHKLDGSSRDSLLMMATRRLDHLAEQLRHLALGLPEPATMPLAAHVEAVADTEVS